MQRSRHGRIFVQQQPGRLFLHVAQEAFKIAGNKPRAGGGVEDVQGFKSQRGRPRRMKRVQNLLRESFRLVKNQDIGMRAENLFDQSRAAPGRAAQKRQRMRGRRRVGFIAPAFQHVRRQFLQQFPARAVHLVIGIFDRDVSVFPRTSVLALPSQTALRRIDPVHRARRPADGGRKYYVRNLPAFKQIAQGGFGFGVLSFAMEQKCLEIKRPAVLGMLGQQASRFPSLIQAAIALEPRRQAEAGMDRRRVGQDRAFKAGVACSKRRRR